MSGVPIIVVDSVKLREPFPKAQIGKIPASKGRPALDFVGHAAVTDRLNKYAGDWSYTVDELMTIGNECWIRGTMTIGGVSRVEFGDGKDPKEAIGNFIRRAAMRWGVAIDLWSREELDSSGGAAAPPSSTATERGGQLKSTNKQAISGRTTAPSPGSIVEGSEGDTSTTSVPAGEGFGEGPEPAGSGHFDKEAIEQQAVRLCGGNTAKVMAHVRRKHPDWLTDPEYPVKRFEDLAGWHFLAICEDFLGAAVDA